jgi:tRNA pseudouridine55 synthase
VSEEEPVIIRKNNLFRLSGDLEQYPAGIIIPVYKPIEWTSTDVVRKIKFRAARYFRKKNIKVGHAGTLDPLATGVLVICLGRATKKSEQLQTVPKEYVAEFTFGATTPSFDREKEIDATFPFEHITRGDIEEALVHFTGEQDQVPPVFSAKFIDGSRAYDMARAGRTVKLKPSRITIYSMDLMNFDPPVASVRIKCSKGTYIRAVARDLGTALKSGAYMTALERVSAGGFDIADALSPDEVVGKVL